MREVRAEGRIGRPERGGYEHQNGAEKGDAAKGHKSKYCRTSSISFAIASLSSVSSLNFFLSRIFLSNSILMFQAVEVGGEVNEVCLK